MANHWRPRVSGNAVTSVAGKVGVVALDTGDVVVGADQNYVTDAQLGVIEDTSGVNTGDQVGDGVTITGAGTGGDPFVAAGGGGGSGFTDFALDPDTSDFANGIIGLKAAVIQIDWGIGSYDAQTLDLSEQSDGNYGIYFTSGTNGLDFGGVGEGFDGPPAALIVGIATVVGGVITEYAPKLSPFTQSAFLQQALADQAAYGAPAIQRDWLSSSTTIFLDHTVPYDFPSDGAAVTNAVILTTDGSNSIHTINLFGGVADKQTLLIIGGVIGISDSIVFDTANIQQGTDTITNVSFTSNSQQLSLVFSVQTGIWQVDTANTSPGVVTAIPGATAIPTWRKVATLTYEDFQAGTLSAGDTVSTIVFFTAVADNITYFESAQLNLIDAFAAPTLATGALSTADISNNIIFLSIDATSPDIFFGFPQDTLVKAPAATCSIVLTLTGDTVPNLTAGSLDIWVLLSKVPV